MKVTDHAVQRLKERHRWLTKGRDRRQLLEESVKKFVVVKTMRDGRSFIALSILGKTVYAIRRSVEGSYLLSTVLNNEIAEEILKNGERLNNRSMEQLIRKQKARSHRS